MADIKIQLTNCRVITYTPECKHEKLTLVDVLDSADMDGWPIKAYIYVCLDCGDRIEKDHNL